ncbi:MAG: YopX family protein [Oscillospiraceae bacterium]|nr:YopX family protein [Oscillospiraceae bacterium]
MREILFRGKQISDGGWVYGYPYSDGKKSYIAYEGKKDCIIHEVVPETLKPYTGLTDKNGKMIFEGDIIKGKEKATYAIGYSDATAGFYAKATLPQRILPCMNIGTMKHYEVIGNIHDNPELMGGNQT